jgi:energy-coupling factor transporter ATP-binding protein EcfA2
MPGTFQPPVISWQEFLHNFHWKQGEHMTLLGTTGYGKSTLERIIIPKYRNYVVVFATKRRDDTMDKFERAGFKVQKKFSPEVENHIILRPPINPDDDRSQRDEFNTAMTEIFWAGNWCMVWDEAAYLSYDLGLDRKMNRMLMQGRSLGISCVTTSQRPAFIPTYAYDMATHFFFWKLKLSRDVEKVGHLGGLDMAGMRDTIRQLDKYQFLYYNKDTDYSVITTPEV